MLFLQGTRDEFADLSLLKSVIERLGVLATLKLFQDGNHSFHVPARTGRKDEDVRNELLNALVDWIELVLSGGQVSLRKPAARSAA